MKTLPNPKPALIAARLLAALLAAMTSQSAFALEYCRRDSSSDMWNCSYATMDQCQAAVSGRGGYCRHDPFLATTAAARVARSTRSTAEANARMILAKDTDKNSQPCHLTPNMSLFTTGLWDHRPPCQHTTER
ncbi:DUF3551 domain-containing protein [Bradyrhizobium liaoningense]|uniref:DUF3551 domain-containing protein n=1 Tax=Bradyrhizobium liaoningense TaxID=43992 RepID=UPI001BA6672D|nr:DUF3551 domain-containing protein [Bradyrhizobium liaoningense]MBR0816611.1 DUF3551 domain-containing protein [Bradyrhizobium liaoningense]